MGAKGNAPEGPLVGRPGARRVELVDAAPYPPADQALLMSEKLAACVTTHRGTA